MNSPFLLRFAEVLDATAMPPLRLNAQTQTAETLEDGLWVPSTRATAFAGQQATKTTVITESTDYR